MNRLPAVLQKEIWEYVRGDRQHWKSQYDQVINHLRGAIDLAETDLFMLDSPSSKSHLILVHHIDVWKRRVNTFIDCHNLGFRLYASQKGYHMFADSYDEWQQLNVMFREYSDRLFLS